MIVAFLLFFAFASGCMKNEIGDDETALQEQATIRVGVSIRENNDPWMKKIFSEMTVAAPDCEIELVDIEGSINTAEEQLQATLTLLDDEIEQLILFPEDSSIVEPITSAAAEKGVSVILISHDGVDNPLCAATFFLDFRKEGELCANELFELSGGHVLRILEITGPEDSVVSAARAEGFREEAALHANLIIVDTIVSSFSRADAQALVNDYLSGTATSSKLVFDAIFATSDEDGLGAMAALNVAGLEPGRSIPIVSINGMQDALKAVFAGDYSATVESARSLGTEIIDVARRIHSNDLMGKTFISPYRVFNEDTDDWSLTVALYY